MMYVSSFKAWMGVVSIVLGLVAVEARGQTQTEEIYSDRVIVKLRSDNAAFAKPSMTTSADARALADRVGLMMTHTHALGSDLHVLRIAAPITAHMLAQIRHDGRVEFAEIDRRRFAHTLADDPGFANQWYLRADALTPAAINAVSAWDATLGNSNTVVAVIDTGVLFDHPDLGRASAGGRLLDGYDFVSADSSGTFAAANDGNGRDADASDPGDWITQSDKQNALFKNCDVANSSWHGTRVSGILGAITGNAQGVAGITWSGLILPVRVLGKCGGYDSDIIAGMQWAAGIDVPGVPSNPTPAVIENLSLGASGACSQSYRTAIGQVTARNVLIVVSAGNEGGPVDSPANCASVVAVAGVRHAGTKVGYSNLGPEVTLSAPAGNCGTSGEACAYSLDTTTNAGATSPDPNGYTYTNLISQNLGTSFSAPIVSGIAALMHAVNANLTPAQLLARLQEGAKPFPTQSADTGVTQQCAPEPQGSTNVQNTECVCTASTCGAGLANAAGAVAAALRPIASIAVTSAVVAGKDVTLDASHSAAACGRSIVAYQWQAVPATSATVSNDTQAIATVTAPTSGAITLHITVTDDHGASDSADITVFPTFTSTQAPADARSVSCPVASTGSSPGSGTNGTSPTSTSAPAARSGGGGGALGGDELIYLLVLLWVKGKKRLFANERGDSLTL